jgi:hypothetical protein
MRRQFIKVVFGMFLTLTISKGHGQCSFLDGKFEAGHNFKKNVRHGLDTKKVLGKGELISLAKIDSIGSTNPTWFAAIQFNDKPMGQVDVEFTFQNKKTIKIRGQRPKLSELDTMYFGDSELVFPIDGSDIEMFLNIDIVSIRIKTEEKLTTFAPERKLLKGMTKCLM